MFSEQVFLNAGPLIVRGLEGAAAAGFIFNVLMIARAPLQLFQAVSTSILPHLTSLHTSGDRGRTSGSSTARCGWSCSAIAAFTALVALAVIVAGPQLMQLAFSKKFTYDRDRPAAGHRRHGPLPLLGDGQPGLPRAGPGAARLAALDRLRGLLHRLELRAADHRRRVPPGRDRLRAHRRAAAGLLFAIYRRPHERAEDLPSPGSTEELEARLAAARREGVGCGRMGGHDAELILIGGVLLAAGDRRRAGRRPGPRPGAAALPRAGDAGRLGGDRRRRVRRRGADPTLGTIGLVLILFEGGLTAGWNEIRPVLGTAIALATLGTFLTAMATGLAAIWIFDLSTLQGLILGLRGGRHRLRGDLRRAARLAAEAAPGAHPGGRVGDERPGRAAARRRLRRLDPRPLLRRRRHARLAFVVKLSLGAAFGIAVGWPARRSIGAVELPTQGLYPVATIATAALSYGIAETPRRLGLPLRLRGRPGARHRLAAGAQHRGRLPPGPQLAGPDRALLPARPARLPQPALGDVAGKGLLLSAVLIFLARPLATMLVTAFRPAQPAREDDAGLGGAARRDPDLAGDLPGRRRASPTRS